MSSSTEGAIFITEASTLPIGNEASQQCKAVLLLYFVHFKTCLGNWRTFDQLNEDNFDLPTSVMLV